MLILLTKYERLSSFGRDKCIKSACFYECSVGRARFRCWGQYWETLSASSCVLTGETLQSRADSAFFLLWWFESLSSCLLPFFSLFFKYFILYEFVCTSLMFLWFCGSTFASPFWTVSSLLILLSHSPYKCCLFCFHFIELHPLLHFYTLIGLCNQHRNANIPHLHVLWFNWYTVRTKPEEDQV